jgi:hypothetical protein
MLEAARRCMAQDPENAGLGEERIAGTQPPKRFEDDCDLILTLGLSWATARRVYRPCLLVPWRLCRRPC